MRWIIAVLLAFAPSNLFAQPAAPRAYVFGGPTASWAEGVATDEYRTYLAAPGGWSTGWFVGGGVRVSRHVSIEGEWRRSGVVQAVEPSRYFITYSARRRDSGVGFGARFHVPLARHVVLEPVGLLEFVREQSWLAQRVDTPGLPPHGSLDEYAPFVNSWGRGFCGGTDLRLGGGNVALLPGVRYHRVFRGTDAISTWPGGRSQHALDVTVAARVDF